MELAAQHCLGLKELGRDLALLVPPELEKQVCTDLNEDQLRPLINPIQGAPEFVVTLGMN